MLYKITQPITLAIHLRHKRFPKVEYKDFGIYELLEFSDTNWEIINIKKYGSKKN